MNRVQIIGHGDAEVKIYPIRRKTNRYRFFQIAWYELGERRTKTLVDPAKAKSFAQQVHVSLLNQGRATEVTPQDIQVLRDAEAITASLGVSLPFAIREWADARKLLGPGILGSAKSLADALHGIADAKVPDALERFIESKRKAGMSKRHFQTLCSLLRPFSRRFESAIISHLKAGEVEEYIGSVKGNARTKNNVTATIKTLFNWAQRQGHLRADHRFACEHGGVISPCNSVVDASRTRVFLDGRQAQENVEVIGNDGSPQGWDPRFLGPKLSQNPPSAGFVLSGHRCLPARI